MKIYQKDSYRTILKVRCPEIERYEIHDNGTVIHRRMFIFNGKAFTHEPQVTSLSEMGWEAAKGLIGRLREIKYKKVA